MNNKALVALIIIVILIITVGVSGYLYLSKKYISDTNNKQNPQAQDQQQATSPESVGASTNNEDTTSAIEEDLNSIDLGDIDSGLKTIDADLETL